MSQTEMDLLLASLNLSYMGPKLAQHKLDLDTLIEITIESELFAALSMCGIDHAVDRVKFVARLKKLRRVRDAKLAAEAANRPPPPLPDDIPPPPKWSSFSFASFRAQIDAKHPPPPPPEPTEEELEALNKKKKKRPVLQSRDRGTDAFGFFPIKPVQLTSISTSPTERKSDADEVKDGDEEQPDLELSDPETVFELGVVCASTLGSSYEPERALQFFERAHTMGHTEATFKLASIYEKGSLGVTVDLAKAMRFYKIAADDGDADAMFNLAYLLHNHHSAEGSSSTSSFFSRSNQREDPEDLRARIVLNSGGPFDWYQRAVDAGHVRSMVNLGVLKLRAGNEKGAAKLFMRAAEAGDVQAMLNMGSMFESAALRTPAPFLMNAEGVNVDHTISVDGQGGDLLGNDSHRIPTMVRSMSSLSPSGNNNGSDAPSTEAYSSVAFNINGSNQSKTASSSSTAVAEPHHPATYLKRALDYYQRAAALGDPRAESRIEVCSLMLASAMFYTAGAGVSLATASAAPLQSAASPTSSLASVPNSNTPVNSTSTSIPVSSTPEAASTSTESATSASSEETESRWNPRNWFRKTETPASSS